MSGPKATLGHDARVFVSALLAGLPGAGVSLALLWGGDYRLKVQCTLTFLIVTAWLGLSASVRGQVVRPLQTIANLLVQLANLSQTEQSRQQQQALLQQQQGLYLNSLYQLSSSYQITSLDWAEAYSGLAQAWMSYYRDLCGSRG